MPGSDPAATGTPVAAVAGLIGANGAGKTTAVECIQGLTAFMREVELGASAVDAQGRRPEGSAHNQKGAP